MTAAGVPGLVVSLESCASPQVGYQDKSLGKESFALQFKGPMTMPPVNRGLLRRNGLKRAVIPVRDG
jgi:hypothetical protein